MKKILACDGGGIRGAATAEFLRLLEEKTGRPILDQFDLFAGTSTGAIIALGIGSIGMTANEISSLYDVENAKKIMEYKQASESSFQRFMQRVFSPKFDGKGKLDVLNQYFKDHLLKSSKKQILAVAYDVEKRSVAVVKNANCGELSVVEVADASSAAPTYFPSRKISDGRWLIDGGVTANNPTMCAIAEAHKLWPNEEIRVLSIGTGFKTKKIVGSGTEKAGYLGWAFSYDLINTVMDETIVHYQATQILNDKNYIRVNSDLIEASDDLDDISESNIQNLKKLGKEWFDKFGDDSIKLLWEENK